MLARYEKLILDHPLFVIIVSLLFTVFFGWFIRDLHFSSSTERFFVKDSPEKVNFEKAKQYFGNDQIVVIAMLVPEGSTIYSRVALEKLRRVTEAVKTVEGVENAISLTNIPAMRAPWNPAAGRYEKRLEVKPLIPEIPAEDDYSRPEWQAILADLERTPLYEYNLVSKARRDEDGRIIPAGVRAAAILVFVTDFKEETFRYRAVIADLKKELEKFEGPEEFYLAGIPYTRVEMEKQMTRDLKILIPLAVVVLAVMLLGSYGTLRGILLPLSVIAAATIITLGLTEIMAIPITLVTLILPPLMLALGSSYVIHTMSEYVAESSAFPTAREVVKHTVSKVTLPIVVCAFTTSIGFASLILNRIPAIQDLGYAAVVGVFISAAAALLIAPAMLMLLKKQEMRQERSSRFTFLDPFLVRLSQFNLRRRPHVAGVVIFLVLLSLVGLSRVEINTDFLAFFSLRDPVRVAANLQAEHLAGAAPFNIVLAADRENAFRNPELLKRMEELQRWAEEEVEGIDTTLSLVDYIKLLNQALHLNDRAYYRIPDSPLEVSHLLLLYSTAGKPEDFAPYVTSDYSMANILVRSRLVGSKETSRALQRIENKARELFQVAEYQPVAVVRPPTQTPAPVKSGGGEEEEIIWEEGPGTEAGSSAGGGAGKETPAEEEIDWGEEDSGTLSAGERGEDETPGLEAGSPSLPHVKVYVTGTIRVLNKSADAVSRGQVTGLGTTLLAIFGVMSLLFLSPRIGLLALLPNLVPIFLLFGLMGASDVTLNFSTSLIAAIALGIGVDDTIHFISRFNQEVQKTCDQGEAMTRTLRLLGKPIIYTSVALVFGFGIFMFSDFVPIRQFGFLTAFTILAAMFCNLIILPSLLVSVRIVTLWELLDLEIGDNPAHYIKIFHGLTNHQARIAVLMGYLREYEDGEWIIREGELGSEMFVVLKGLVDIVKGEGENEVLLATTQPGDAFGEMALLRHTTRTASARARGKVKLFIIDEHTFFRLQKRYPRISSNILYQISQTLSDRLQSANLRVYECSLDLREMGKDR